MKQHEATFTEAADPQEASAVNEEPNPSEKSRCSELNKKGEPCKAWAMHDARWAAAQRTRVSH